MFVYFHWIKSLIFRILNIDERFSIVRISLFLIPRVARKNHCSNLGCESRSLKNTAITAVLFFSRHLVGIILGRTNPWIRKQYLPSACRKLTFKWGDVISQKNEVHLCHVFCRSTLLTNVCRNCTKFIS